MRLVAREVLADCRLAHRLLETDQNPASWRVNWAGAVALVRAVGHVLKTVDGKDPILKRIIDDAFRTWVRERSDHDIFWKFIKNERDSILKEYLFNVDIEEKVCLVVQSSDDKHVYASLDGNLYRPISAGFGEGIDARDIYQDAVCWWEAQLQSMEQKYLEAKSLP